MKNITFIGAGNMARALIVGLISMGYLPEKITASNPSSEKLQAFQQSFGINVTSDNSEAARHADIVVLSVKPNVLKTVCEELTAVLLEKKPLIVSVAAGVTTDCLSRWLDPALHVVRAMPNTPAAVSAGATGL
ncbi:MAG: NAD(P)-binding domain-containing protein, partial [Coxiellaceae bacterium]|nr:NAD(P)-binding domain-containing protein [Coxiellaceae bacterium]